MHLIILKIHAKTHFVQGTQVVVVLGRRRVDRNHQQQQERQTPAHRWQLHLGLCKRKFSLSTFSAHYVSEQARVTYVRSRGVQQGSSDVNLTECEARLSSERERVRDTRLECVYNAAVAPYLCSRG